VVSLFGSTNGLQESVTNTEYKQQEGGGQRELGEGAHLDGAPPTAAASPSPPGAPGPAVSFSSWCSWSSGPILLVLLVRRRSPCPPGPAPRLRARVAERRWLRAAAS
jgi:hypothetical protein